ncbi:bifunctional ornithine acetyltransferase/N-acetylglutamate synthase [Thioalkalivibrio denitrificans]|uniref:Arginine biosynthesis bifunctional protein ArgJ n=1 Tax=Thioalkalivibrio denitrificans TaxID=108003 RepID=A0A1V3NBQ7_9GAMM|nr:bifunctional glutamate N-acetyltransferase/amino-acid acetyltransferase ArgJ [Thioalkalivibrio denitrificans]OOG22298.1 bifunctional ornithine acetyltransferase/N-acetylglutamate synthase [Thioalkalivibrio denitrificans]
MPINLTEPTELLPVPGVRLGVAAAGIRYRDRADLVLMEVAVRSNVAAVFTQNAFCAAPVIVAREHLAAGGVRYLLINSGNANAGTGDRGLKDARASCAHVAEILGGQAEQVLPFSTGVIGEHLPVPRVREAMPGLAAGLAADNWMDAMRAIMTTDTVGKGISRRVTLSGGTVTLTGIAKGSGMIRPDMATMLAFLATDAVVPAGDLQEMLNAAVEESFNCITVDGDTSTNDACVLAATGASGVRVAEDDDRRRFAAALQAVCDFLAQAIVRDGEGATKFITLHVTGGQTPDEARRVADAVAHSPLVKTALFASDPNWGRILAAVGRAGVAGLDVSRVRIEIGDVLIVEGGGRAAAYTEEAGRQVMDQAEIPIYIHLGRGRSEARVYTCDLSYDYVRINAEYRS